MQPEANTEPLPGAALSRAWLALCGALAIHVTDEAATGFLSVWNPTAAAVQAAHPWAPLPVFRFEEWLGGLIAAVVILVCLTPLVRRGGRVMPVVSYGFAVLMIANGFGHVLATLSGRTVASVRFPRPAPGFYSSPLLIAAGAYLIVALRRNATSSQ